MSIAYTPIYRLPYPAPGEPIRNTRANLQTMAQNIEAALQAGGVAAPGASDLLALSGRVTVLEGMRDTEANIKLSTAGHNLGDVAHATDTGALGMWDGTRWIFYDTKWQAYTPVMSNGAAPGVAWGSPGNAVIAGRYFRTGRTIQCRGNIQLGTTTSYGAAGTGNLNATYPPGYVAAQSTWQPGYSLIEPHGVGMLNNQAGYAGILAGLYPGTPANRRIEFWSTTAAIVTVSGASGTYGISGANHALSWDITYETNFEA